MSKTTSNQSQGEVRPTPPNQDAPSLRFDGLYRSKQADYSFYLRFYADGLVVSISSSDEPFQALALVNRSFYGNSKGRYAQDGAKLAFSVTSQVGVVDYSGTIRGDELALNSLSHINNHKSSNIYHFEEIPGLEPDKSDGVTFYV